MASPAVTAKDILRLVDELRADPQSVDKHQRVRNACNATSWAFLCDAKYPQFLYEYANSHQHDETTSSGLPVWILSAWDIALALQASNTTLPPFSTSSINLQALSLLREVLVNKLFPLMSSPAERARYINQGAPDTASVISAASGLLFALAHSLKVHPDPVYLGKVRTSGAVEVCTLCWLYTPDLPTRITASISLEALLEPQSQPASTFTFDSPPTQHILSRVLDAAGTHSSGPSTTSTTGAEKIVGRCVHMLQDGLGEKGKMTDGHRLVELCLIQWMTDESCKDTLGRYFVQDRRIMTLVVQTVQDALGHADDRGVNWELVDMCGAVLLALSNVSPLPMATLIEYIDRLSLLSVLSTIYTQTTRTEDGNPVPMEIVARAWTNIVELLVHCTTCQAPNCHYVRTDAYVDALRRALDSGELWAKTMDVLFEQARVSKDKASMAKWNSWNGLGKEVGMVYRPSGAKPSVTRDGCWEVSCQRHGAIDEQTEQVLQRCSGCKTARYCSTGCQTKDWKRHKVECKQLRTT